jgi:hypothetical protein
MPTRQPSLKTYLMSAAARRIDMLPATALTDAYGSTQNAFVPSWRDPGNQGEASPVTADGKPLSIRTEVGDCAKTLVYLLRGYRHGLVMVYGQCDFFTSL